LDAVLAVAGVAQRDAGERDGRMRAQVETGRLDLQPIAGLALDAVLNDVSEQPPGDSDRKHDRDQDDHDGDAGAENFQKTHRKPVISQEIMARRAADRLPAAKGELSISSRPVKTRIVAVQLCD